MIDGKSIMSWNVPAVEGGNPHMFVEALELGNFEGVALKIADGNDVHVMKSWSPWPSWGENVRKELVTALKGAGFKVFFWHFLYGYDPAGEARIAIEKTEEFKPDGYIWNVEGRFDSQPNAEGNARSITRAFKLAHPDVSQGLCWWALPKSPVTGTQWHPIPVAKAFLEICDVGMPMMYWQGDTAADAVSYFSKSLKLWRDHVTTKPIVPIGRAYNGDGGAATPESITAFGNKVLEVAESQNLIGNTWYSFDKAFNNPSWYEALSLLPKFEIPITLSTEIILERLMLEHKELFPELDL